MDTSGYQLFDLDNLDFYWKNNALDVDVFFGRGIDTPFSPLAFDDLEMGGSAESPLLLDEKQDKESSPPTTPVSERPTQHTALLESRPYGTRKQIVPDYVWRNLFQ